jgi:hypothetical protein
MSSIIGHQSRLFPPICFPFMPRHCPGEKIAKTAQFDERLIAFNSAIYKWQFLEIAAAPDFSILSSADTKDRSNPLSKARIAPEKLFFSGICMRLLHDFPLFIAQNLDGQESCRCPGG